MVEQKKREDSFELEGQQAFAAGVKVGDNPYHEDTTQHWKWMNGWATAGMRASLGRAVGGANTVQPWEE